MGEGHNDMPNPELLGEPAGTDTNPNTSTQLHYMSQLLKKKQATRLVQLLERERLE
jgi:hypothetical protein